MKVLTISGSSRVHSNNLRLLQAIELLCPQHNLHHFSQIIKLPLFKAEDDCSPWPEEVIMWRKSVKEADAVIISTPEYIYNIPAVLKNALEWLTSSGEMMNKKVLPITYTPHSPRGDKTMQSLIWSLQALKANIVTQFPLYQSEINFDDEGNITNKDIRLMLEEAINILTS